MDILNLTKSQTPEYRRGILNAWIVVVDGKVYKNRSLIDDSLVLKYIETPQVLQDIIELEKKRSQEKVEKVMEEFLLKDLSEKNFQVKIDIQGTSGSGKTNIALLIYDTLKAYGIESNLIEEYLETNDIDYARANRHKILSTMADRVGVNIETHQAIKS